MPPKNAAKTPKAGQTKKPATTGKSAGPSSALPRESKIDVDELMLNPPQVGPGVQPIQSNEREQARPKAQAASKPRSRPTSRRTSVSGRSVASTGSVDAVMKSDALQGLATLRLDRDRGRATEGWQSTGRREGSGSRSASPALSSGRSSRRNSAGSHGSSGKAAAETLLELKHQQSRREPAAHQREEAAASLIKLAGSGSVSQPQAGQARSSRDQSPSGSVHPGSRPESRSGYSQPMAPPPRRPLGTEQVGPPQPSDTTITSRQDQSGASATDATTGPPQPRRRQTDRPRGPQDDKVPYPREKTPPGGIETKKQRLQRQVNNGQAKLKWNKDQEHQQRRAQAADAGVSGQDHIPSESPREMDARNAREKAARDKAQGKMRVRTASTKPPQTDKTRLSRQNSKKEGKQIVQTPDDDDDDDDEYKAASITRPAAKKEAVKKQAPKKQAPNKS